jgi:surfeit locus 1 family protein
MVGVFLSAANWQWQRAVAKELRASEFAAALLEPARRDLAAALAAPAVQGFERVRVQGELDRARLILLDNQVRDSRFGVQVYAVLVDVTGKQVLVDLGWLASDASRRQPALIPELPEQLDTEALLAEPPASGLRLAGSAVPADDGRPLLVTRIEPAELAAVLKRPALQSWVVQLPAEAGSGFERVWRLPGLSADKHRGYALQWLSFAVGTLVFFVLWHRPRKGSPNE